MIPAWLLQPLLAPLPQPFSPLQVDVLRLDQLHPWLSGNKLLKLHGWLQQFEQQQKTGQVQALLSFGGAHSNHIHALAYAAQLRNISLYLMVQAYPEQPLTPTLKDCQALNAHLILVDKKTYARRYDADFLAALSRQYQALIIPEGGMGEQGELGCKALAAFAQAYDEVWLPVGTGTTALGLAKGLAELNAVTTVVGINAVNDSGERLRAWQAQMPSSINWRLIDDAHMGGFAKCTPELLQLIQRYDGLALPLEPIYTAKMLWAFERELQWARQPDSAPEKANKILLIHTGGLQGRRGFGLSVNEHFQLPHVATSAAQ